MQHVCSASTRRSPPPESGYITLATLVLAAVSALFLVAMSGCHSAPTTSAFASTPADKDVESKLRRSDTMTPLQPFDEGFVTASDEP